MNSDSPEIPFSSARERLLVVGGGGSRGAWAGGFAKYLRIKHNLPYRHVWGTSTGGLMAPFIVLDDFIVLESAYTTLSQKDIFDVNPFAKDGDLNPAIVLWRILNGKKTLGESHNLRNLIDRYLTKERYKKIMDDTQKLAFTVCTLNYKNGSVSYLNSADSRSREEMVNWIWASSNQPAVMTFVDEKYMPGGNYVDGGLVDTVPIIKALSYALKHQLNEIDIIVNTPREPIIDQEFKPGNILKNFLRIIEFWRKQVQADNITIGKLLASVTLDSLAHNNQFEDQIHTLDNEQNYDDSVLNLYFYYFPPSRYKENFNDLMFDTIKMRALWDAGERGECEISEDSKPFENLANSSRLVLSKKYLKYF